MTRREDRRELLGAIAALAIVMEFARPGKLRFHESLARVRETVRETAVRFDAADPTGCSQCGELHCVRQDVHRPLSELR